MAFVAPLIPVATLALSAASAGVAGYGAIQAGKAQQQSYLYQSAVANANATIAARNAQTELAVGEERALQSGIAGRERISQIRAAVGASGVEADSGSASDVVASQKLVEDKNQQIIRETAGRKSYDYNVQQFGDLTQAALDEMGATEAEKAGDIKAVGSLIGGAASVSDKWMNYNKLGVL